MNEIVSNEIVSNEIVSYNIVSNEIVSTVKKLKKRDDYVMPSKDNYSILLSTNYTIKQLKEISIQHKIKINSSLAKADLVTKIYNFFKNYDNAVVIQKAWRRYLYNQSNKLRGPARLKRNLCVNETDFFTMDSLRDIPYNQFFSFQDTDKMVYGFDIMSIYTLFNKGNDTKIANPYNRNILPKNIKKNMMKLIWLSKLFNEPMNLKMNEDETSTEVTFKTITDRVISLFHDIDILGNYTNSKWFLDLSHNSLIRFLVELNDIWMYRANLSDQIKREICPSYRDLFRIMYINDLRSVSLLIVQDIIITIMEMLVKTGINHDSRCLGANYILCALTLVSPDAAIALPWLYQSVF